MATMIERQHDDSVNDDHEEEEDHAFNFDNLLSRELLKLSLKDRNDIQEEIHGVRCVAPRETPELLQRSLADLSLVLKNIAKETNGSSSSSGIRLPANHRDKRGYKMSLELQHRHEQKLQNRQFQNTTTANNSNNTTATTTKDNKLYVFGDDFMLRFLRFELFDVNKAARRILIFLDLLLDLFGPQALERPIRLDDFSEHEIQIFKKGFWQFIPFRERSGRRIIAILPNGGLEFVSPLTKAKILLYFTWTAGYDAETQRRGLVFLAWFDSTFTLPSSNQRIWGSPADIISVRVSAAHICFQDMPIFYKWAQHLLIVLMGQNNRIKAKIHLGSSVELKYQLQSYGIPIDLIPLSWNGKIKTVYLEQWIRTRKAIEEDQYDKQYGEKTNGSEIIECPLVNDVIFKQGTSLISHPGNAVLRSLIEMKNEAQEEEARNTIKMKRRQVVLDIYEEITSKHKGRFLIWNHDCGLWSELSDREQILSRVEYLVKEYRKSTRAGQRRKEANRRRVVGNLQNSDMAFRSMTNLSSDALTVGRELSNCVSNCAPKSFCGFQQKR